MTRHQEQNHHGVMMRVNDLGVLIIGKPNIGKSSLALELLHYGYQLIADDSVEFSLATDNNVIARCPEMLAGLLHCRDLGLINVSELFGSEAYRHQQKLDYIIELVDHSNNAVSLTVKPELYTVCGQSFPTLCLELNSPASIVHRLTTWLKMQSSDIHAEVILQNRQNKQMIIQ
ncbi:MAG: serine kinase [Gammaproteobacteria bacterium]|nr:serine kinase [Gammaproteobacteria bacterium]